MADTLREYRITGVVHLAADKQVEESMRQPLTYYRRNVVNLMQLLSAMADAGVGKLVFSSSAAVYGMVDSAAGRRGPPDPADQPLRGDEADRRVADPRPGPGHRPPVRRAALLQRRRHGQPASWPISAAPT